ncbi:fumarylacetoacetate hydrolase family protein [Streptomyces sp. 796.1]|uniref:fumarylacetoacetate hydrolase family protein n=1 Tax=Streptomyces sp. 796.1 TaxID=3163029 RepID=UPI0039C9F6E8
MPHPLGTQPSKIIAVHLNYPCRAKERGRIPKQPSYFLKPPSSLAGTGDALVRPADCELMSFEGEIALVIGRRAHRVSPEQGWSHVAWVTAANDAGAYDLRYADRGSNLRSKGADGFTPVGPRLLPAADLDPAALRLRTWVGGELVQDADTASLLFPFGDLIADLSRLVTLEPGDVILTGTPAGASVTSPGDTVEVEVSTLDGQTSSGRLTNPVVESDHPLEAWGAMPRVDAALRADAWGPAHPQQPALAPEIADALRGLATATLSSQLRKRGFQHMTIDGVRPTDPGAKLVGTAHTLRYLPLREDLFARYGNGMNAQKRAVEELRPGQVLVMDARRDPTSGTIGDILALRAQRRGAAGIVTDGGLRDSAAVADLNLPTYYAAEHPAVLGRRHVPWDTGVPIACGGALVQPGDILVGDADGVVIVPPDQAEQLIADSTEQELQERFIAEQVSAGEPIEGLYPLGPAWKTAYEQWRTTQS